MSGERYEVVDDVVTVADYDGFTWRTVQVTVPVIRKANMTTFTVASNPLDADPSSTQQNQVGDSGKGDR